MASATDIDDILEGVQPTMTKEQLHAVTARAVLETYKDGGSDAAPEKILGFRYCAGEDEPTFTIYLGQTPEGRHQAINVTRAEVERVLAANPI